MKRLSIRYLMKTVMIKGTTHAAGSDGANLIIEIKLHE